MGARPTATALSLDAFATDVAALIERVAGRKAHVLGHSIGAATALILALRRPEFVGRLVLISGGFSHEAEMPPEGMSIDQMVEGTVAFLGAVMAKCSLDGEDHFPVVVRKDFELSSQGRSPCARSASSDTGGW
jgi:pimeloyl-ACP methyl ester carboxylesterase